MQISHTEEDAKTKWCPFARSHWSGRTDRSEYQGNRFMSEDGKIDPIVGCAGSHCMAWRWVRTHINNPEDLHGDLIPSDNTHGYCGLAGRPI